MHLELKAQENTELRARFGNISAVSRLQRFLGLEYISAVSRLQRCLGLENISAVSRLQGCLGDGSKGAHSKQWGQGDHAMPMGKGNPKGQFSHTGWE